MPVSEIEANDFDLSINRYKEIVYEKVEYDEPSKILADIEEIEKEIGSGLEELNEMIDQDIHCIFIEYTMYFCYTRINE